MTIKTHAAEQLDIECMAGETFAMSIQFKNADGTDYSLTDHSFQMRILSNDGVLTTWSSPADITISGSTITIAKALPVTPGQHEHRIMMTLPNNNTYTTHKGFFNVKPAI